MTTVTLTQAKNDFDRLINLADSGEDIFIIRDNMPKIKLVVVSDKPKKRFFGQHRAKAWISSDFDAPLPDHFWGTDKKFHQYPVELIW